MYDNEALKNLTCTYFKFFYQQDRGSISTYQIKGIFPNSYNFDYSPLCIFVATNEVCATLFDMKS